MRKTILILGAGFLQSFVIKKARDMGYRVLAIDKNQDAVGFQYADEFEVIDIVDQDACLRYARENDIHGVMTAATDYGVLSSAFIASNMVLPGLDYDVAKVIKSKYLVRKVLAENDLDGFTQFYEISDMEHLDDLRHSIHFPVIVKPCDGSGSKGIHRADNERELVLACDEAMAISLSHKALIEDFVTGCEYDVESFVYGGEVYVMGVMGKTMTEPPDYAELGHYYPSGLHLEAHVKKVVSDAIKALGINFGAVNMDVIVNPDGRVYIVDVGARMGGNLIGSHIIPLGTGIDYMGNLIRASVGDAINNDNNRKRKHVSTRLLALRPGKVLQLPDFDAICQKHGVDIYHSLQVDGIIRQHRNNLDGCGYVLAVGNCTNEVEQRVENAKNEIDLSIVRY